MPKLFSGRLFLALAALALVAAGDAGAAQAARKPATKPAATAPDGALDAIRRRGSIRIGVATIPPWSFKDPKGDWLGFDVDLARQLASDLGVELKLVPLPFRQFIGALDDGQVDVLASQMSVTPQRALAVDFTRPLATTPLELAVRKTLAGTTSFDTPGMTIGARRDSFAAMTARNRFPKATLVPLDNETQAIDELVAGKINAAIVAGPRARLEALRVPDAIVVASVAPRLPSRVAAFAVRRHEPSLLNFLNAWVAYYEADGWIGDRQHEWFDTLDWLARLQRD